MTKVLNLVNSEKSDIKYKISRFPDGQSQLTIDQESMDIEYVPLKIGENILIHHSIQIKSRLNSFIDLEIIICAVKSLRNLGVKEIHLYTPYFLGSRSDRQFEHGSNNYLKDIICPIINSLDLDSVTVMDPHSDCLEMGLNNFKKGKLGDFYDWCYREIQSREFVLISPDAGASKKIYKVAEQIRYEGDIITCSKDRDENSKLTKCVVPFKIQSNDYLKDVVIIDDICDGGATFINIIKALKEVGYTEEEFGKFKKYLVVTHGIFSKGLKELSEYFDGIYCTNSYRDINSMNEFGMHNEKYLHKIKQLNVF